jgi:hypothetical protein
MKSTAKAIALLRELKDRLSFRINGSLTIDTIRQAFDADGYPMLFLSHGGVETSGNPVILLHLRPVNAVSKDVFGRNNIAFTPHVMGFCFELTGAGAAIPDVLDLLMVMFEIAKDGLKVNIYELANGTAVTEANFDIAVLAGPNKILDFDMVNRMKGN